MQQIVNKEKGKETIKYIKKKSYLYTKEEKVHGHSNVNEQRRNKTGKIKLRVPMKINKNVITYAEMIMCGTNKNTTQAKETANVRNPSKTKVLKAENEACRIYLEKRNGANIKERGNA